MERDMPCMDSRIFCIFICFLTCVSTYRYVSENYKNSEGNTMLEKIVNLSRSWKLVPDDEKKVCCLILGLISF